MENLSIALKLKEIVLQSRYLNLTDIQEQTYCIPYEELVLAYISIHDTGSGEENSLMKPALEDITEDMDGELVMLDRRHYRWSLQMGLSGKKAGAVLKELSIRAPYMLLGGQTWFDETEEEDFTEVRKMVDIMRACESSI